MAENLFHCLQFAVSSLWQFNRGRWTENLNSNQEANYSIEVVKYKEFSYLFSDKKLGVFLGEQEYNNLNILYK